MIGPKCQLASFVVRERLSHGQENALVRRMSLVGMPRQRLKFGDDRVESTTAAGVIQIEEPVRSVVRMKRQPQQSLFRAIEVRQALDVEKVSRQQRSVLN